MRPDGTESDCPGLLPARPADSCSKIPGFLEPVRATVEARRRRCRPTFFIFPCGLTWARPSRSPSRGALAGLKRGYDIVGVFVLALVSSIGGGLIRDGIFLSGNGPTPLLTDGRYLLLVVVATIATAFLGR